MKRGWGRLSSGHAGLEQVKRGLGAGFSSGHAGLEQVGHPSGALEQASRIQTSGLPCRTQVRFIRTNCSSHPLPSLH